jgi:glycosyltransferase involved in cell wall biosynthesis
MTLVTVIMAARDAEATIDEAIGSIVAQTHADWELLVVDDGSTDRTREVALARGDPRIRLLEPGRLGVLAQLRNAGIEAAAGEWIALLDADDAWLPAKLERQLAAAGDAGVVHTDADRLVDGRREHVAVERPPGPLLAALVRNNFVYSSSVLVRRSLLAEHGAFDPDPELYGSPDYELWLRLAPVTPFVYVGEPLLLYRVHAGQMTADWARTCRGTLAALERQPELAHEVDRTVLDRRLGMLRMYARAPGRGRRELLRALRAHPGDLAAWSWLARSFL